MVYAYRYLFDPRYGAAPSPYHPHSRLACDLYNRSLAAVIAYASTHGIRYQQGLRLPLQNGELELGTRRSNIAWPPEAFERFEPAYNIEVSGLAEHYRTYGIGVPLVAVRRMTPTPSGSRRAAWRANRAAPPRTRFQLGLHGRSCLV